MTRNKAIRFCSKAEKMISWMTAHLEEYRHNNKFRSLEFIQLTNWLNSRLLAWETTLHFSPVFKTFFYFPNDKQWLAVWVILSALNNVGHCFCLLVCFLKLIWLLFLEIPESFITRYEDNLWKEIKKHRNKRLNIAREEGLCSISGE